MICFILFYSILRAMMIIFAKRTSFARGGLGEDILSPTSPTHLGPLPEVGVAASFS